MALRRNGWHVQGDDLEASVFHCWLDLVASHVEVASEDEGSWAGDHCSDAIPDLLEMLLA
jgi:hypothetical protein